MALLTVPLWHVSVILGEGRQNQQLKNKKKNYTDG